MPAIKSLPCPRCQSAMVRSTHSSGNAAGLAGALIVLVIGLIVLVLIPVIGWVAGPLIMLAALGMGGKRQKVWKCRPCGYISANLPAGAHGPPTASVAPASAGGPPAGIVYKKPMSPRKQKAVLYIVLAFVLILAGLIFAGALVGEKKDPHPVHRPGQYVNDGG